MAKGELDHRVGRQGAAVSGRAAVAGLEGGTVGRPRGLHDAGLPCAQVPESADRWYVGPANLRLWRAR